MMIRSHNYTNTSSTRKRWICSNKNQHEASRWKRLWANSGKTKLGWFIMSPWVEFDKNTMLLTQTSQADFENLCRLDVLGLADSSENDQDAVYDDFKENLMRNQAGWYETNLPWKTNHPDLPTNETGSRRRLNNLVKRLERNGTYQRYDDIIQDQLEQKIIELASAEVTGKEFYIPHKGIVRQSAQTTKLRIVYDASARESNIQTPNLHWMTAWILVLLCKIFFGASLYVRDSTQYSLQVTSRKRSCRYE